MQITLVFHGNLKSLLARDLAGNEPIHHYLERDASIKDVVESFGVPHTEIERLMVNDVPVSFAYQVRDGDRIAVYPPVPPVDLSQPTLLRQQALSDTRFLVDINVGKLAKLLRMAGFDTLYQPGASDAELAEISEKDQRVLLTRDRKLLNRKNIVFGHLVRECQPHRQLAEIIFLYGLRDKVRPFCRCMACNGRLEPVTKEDILHRLEPLTKKYYDAFYRCQVCDKIYWAGSHRDKMTATLQKALAIHNR